LSLQKTVCVITKRKNITKTYLSDALPISLLILFKWNLIPIFSALKTKSDHKIFV